MTLREAAERTGVTPATLRRWVAAGIIPEQGGQWSGSAIAHARVIARLRQRGHPLEEIREAAASGRLAFGYLEELFPSSVPELTLEEAARDTGLEPALIERIYASMGMPRDTLERMTADDLALLSNIAGVLGAGFPLVALLQMVRVYGQAMAQVADAEVRLFHMYVHEPLMREGVPGLEVAEEMEGLARELLPLALPVIGQIHRRFLAHFVEQDIVGHMESVSEGVAGELGRIRVAIAFADLAGYTRLTEEEGDEQAVNAVERFVEEVERTLPQGARVIKTIGDEVMIVGSDTAGLTRWAVAFQEQPRPRPLPRIGVHHGETLYRDGDYYGREVNQAARVAARSAGGEVLVTRPVVDQAGRDLEFEPIGEVRLKGFTGVTELFLARPAED